MSRSQNKDLEGLSVSELEMLLKEELAKEQKDITLIHSLLENLKAKSTTLPEVTQEEVDAALLALQESKYILKEKERPTLWKKPILAIAALFCVVLLAVPMVSGTPFIQELIAKWNEDFFWIETPGTPVEPPENYVFQTDNPGLQQLYEAVTELGITEPVVPMWLPDGFETASVETITNKDNEKVTACFVADYIEIVYCLERRKDTVKQNKNNENPGIWEYAGIEHFYLSNHIGSKVVWENGDYEIMISSSLNKSVMETIIRSIYYWKEG